MAVENKIPLGIRIFGWAEVIIGTIGTLVLVFQIFLSICILLRQPSEIAAYAIMFSSFVIFIFLPSPWLLRAGIGVLKGNPMGVKINRFIVRLVSVLVGIVFIIQLMGIINDISSRDSTRISMWVSYVTCNITVFIVLILPIILFLRHPHIKSKDQSK